MLVEGSSFLLGVAIVLTGPKRQDKNLGYNTDFSSHHVVCSVRILYRPY